MATNQTQSPKKSQPNTRQAISKDTKKKDEEYMRLGKQMSEMYDAIRPNKKQLYTSSLIKGFLGGFGGVLGATIGISLLLYVLTMLETIPYVEDISKSLQTTIQGGTSQQK